LGDFLNVSLTDIISLVIAIGSLALAFRINQKHERLAGRERFRQIQSTLTAIADAYAAPGQPGHDRWRNQLDTLSNLIRQSRSQLPKASGVCAWGDTRPADWKEQLRQAREEVESRL